MRYFLDIVWEKGDFLANFLEDEIQEKDVVISDWRNIASSDILEKPVRYERTITSMHPLPISLPWLPLAISSTNIQTVEYDCLKLQLRILEISVIKGIPFVEPTIITEWTVEEPSPTSCHVSVNLKFSYKKASVLQALVESNSKSELLRFFELWQIHLSEKLLDLKVTNELHKLHYLHHLVNLLPAEDSLVPESPTLNCDRNNEDDTPSTLDLVSLTTQPSDKEYFEAPEVILISSKYSPESINMSNFESCMEKEKTDIKLNRSDRRNCLLNLNNVHVLEAFIILLHSNCLIKIMAAITVNSYAKMDVAAYLRIEVTGIIRSA